MTNQLSDVTEKLETTWRAIQAQHSSVQDAVVVIYRHEKGDRRGHFHAGQWKNGAGRFDEVHISSLILAEPIDCILRTLLHEAVHSQAEAEGIQDTSRDGQYHNRRFETLAQDMGLVVERDARIGRRTTGLLPGTLERYAGALPSWEETQRLYQEEYRGNGATNRYAAVRLQCSGCGRILRMSRKAHDVGPVGCMPCEAEFLES